MIKTNQRGFTLIELVVVIVILGILAAFAVPRFMGMEGEARAATVKSLGGSLKAAAAMAHAKCMAQNCGVAGFVAVEGNNITMVNSYPNRASVQNTLQTLEGFTPSNVAGLNGTLARRFTKNGTVANCYIDYNEAAAGLAPVVSYADGAGGSTVPATAAQELVVARALAANC